MLQHRGFPNRKTRMQITIAGGILTTEHEAASFTSPVFIFGGVGYEPGGQMDGGSSSGKQNVSDIVAKAYSLDSEQGRKFSVAEYNMIARFAGLPLANYCSGE